MGKNILEEANEIVGSRDKKYGDPIESWERVSRVASELTGKQLTPTDCVTVLIAMKLVRQLYSPKRDNMVDLAGYAHINQLLVDSGK